MKKVGCKYLLLAIITIASLFVSSLAATVCCCDDLNESTEDAQSCHPKANQHHQETKSLHSHSKKSIAENAIGDCGCKCIHESKSPASFDESKNTLKKKDVQGLATSAGQMIISSEITLKNAFSVFSRKLHYSANQPELAIAPRGPPCL